MAKFNYTILLQSGTAERGNDERAIVDALYTSLKEYVESEVAEKNKFFSELIQRAQQRLSGSLTPYLSTPLKSDKNDIALSIEDTINDVLKQSGTGIIEISVLPLILYIVEPTKIPLHKQSVSLVRQLIKNGKALLPHGYQKKGKRSGNRYFIEFSVDDFSLILMLSRMVESMLNKYADEHFFVAGDCITETVTHFTTTAGTAKQRVIFYLNRLDVVKEKMQKKLTDLINQFELENVLVAKKIFRTGFGSTAQIQFDTDLTKVSLGSVVTSLIDDNQTVEESLLTGGALAVLEKVIG